MHGSISGQTRWGEDSIKQAASRARARPKAAGRHLKTYPEDQIQRTVVQHLNARGVPGLVFWHTPNSSKLGGKRTSSGIPLAALRLKKLGLRAGVSDLILVHKNKIYALELKSENGRPTEDQLKFLSDIQNAGAFACVCHGTDRALAVLEQWGLLRGKA